MGSRRNQNQGDRIAEDRLVRASHRQGDQEDQGGQEDLAVAHSGKAAKAVVGIPYLAHWYGD